MQTVTADSLLNEAGFLVELESLDEGLTTKGRSSLPANGQLAYDSLPELTTPIRTTPLGMFADSPEPGAEMPEAHRSVLGQVAAAAMFVLMMGVGAAGAALVFHERVVRIFTSW
jgi:hypothetical protein